jgi:hypothetical protein
MNGSERLSCPMRVIVRISLEIFATEVQSDDYAHRPTTIAHNVFAGAIGAEALISRDEATPSRIMATAEVAQFLQVHPNTL